ncbi:glycosyltransferase family 9 protein [Helicobacter sp. 23-1048]
MSKTILLRLPNWLGDCVMCASAFEKLKDAYKDAKFILVGSQVIEVFATDERVERIIIDTSKKAKCRIYATYQLAKLAGSADISFCFTNGFFGALFLFFTRSKVRVGFATNMRSFLLTNAIKMPTIKPLHQVQKYEYLLKGFVSDEVFSSFAPLRLPLHNTSKIVVDSKKAIGINPGAAYGSAKCWEKEYFLEIIKAFLEQGYVVYLFGSGAGLQRDSKDAQQTQKYAFLQSKNFIDVTNKTTLNELVEAINKLALFITNDSGPMHIAAALGVKTLSIFGSTDTADTCPWNQTIAQEFFYSNKEILAQTSAQDSKPHSLPKDITSLNLVQADNLHIISKHIECAPCKKRICPLSHHLCMKSITPSEVLTLANHILQH